MKSPIILSGMKEICTAAGCSRDQLRDWIDHHGFPACIVGGQYRALPEKIREWFQEQIEQNKHAKSSFQKPCQ